MCHFVLLFLHDNIVVTFVQDYYFYYYHTPTFSTPSQFFLDGEFLMVSFLGMEKKQAKITKKRNNEKKSQRKKKSTVRLLAIQIGEGIFRETY